MAQIRANPSLGNCAIAGMLLGGVAGVLIGLVVGLHVHAATAWAAMFELGIPGAVAGAGVGFLFGCVLALTRFGGRRSS